MNYLKSRTSFILSHLVGAEPLVQRLRELGFVTGSEVQIVNLSLFGEPIIVRVNGTTVALRKEELNCLQKAN